MESRKPSLDLGKELTCSICADLLYQPLTLLDCLHTYCGSCLKEWFRFQAEKVGRNPTPPPPDAVIFTCPSCRSSVRDTRHNATVATLLEMYTAANPAKARSDADKKEMEDKYKPGDPVMPKVKTRERTAEEKRAEEEDRRLIDEVRELSLQEAIAAAAMSDEPPQARAARRQADGRSRSSSDYRAEGRSPRPANGRGENGRSNSDYLSADGGDSQARRRRSESRQRQVEHQSSLRSLIGSEMSERDIQKEIEEFARQIQEEGLLDGLDLDNIDLSRDDELSQRITEAYRRRQRGRSRQGERRSDSRTRHSASASMDSRLRPDSARHPSQHRSHSRSISEVGDRSRPPISSPASLGVREPERRTRRRTASGGQVTTTLAATALSSMDARPAAHSQNDLTLRNPSDYDPTASVPALRIGRSSSSTGVPAAAAAAAATQTADAPANGGANNASFASRAQTLPSATSQTNFIAPELIELAAARNSQSNRPADEASPTSSLVSSPVQSPTTVVTSMHQRTRQLFEEPSISCSRCKKPDIQYSVHYNCKACEDGYWNICVDCYRSGKGCLHWFGFGHGAWKKWEKRKQADESLPMPHILNAGRYLRPAPTTMSSDGKKTLTTDDPKSRLETGTFCSRCFAWANECFWRCDVCNESDWGYCNGCVNQGKSCNHKLLPMAHEGTLKPTYRPRSPKLISRPSIATAIAGSPISGIGLFRPLEFNCKCEICKDIIPPSASRYHCFSCTSTAVPDAAPGDFDICSSCYGGLESKGEVSEENGSSGWRRCPSGHRMIVFKFLEGKVGQWRYVERDLVGGRALRMEPLENIAHPDFQKWSWYDGDEKLERLATTDVSATAPESFGEISYTRTFPPDGGCGLMAHAMWAWYPKSGKEDDLLFPRGANIDEVRDINGDWFFGTYMGAKGMFPAPYVHLPQKP